MSNLRRPGLLRRIVAFSIDAVLVTVVVFVVLTLVALAAGPTARLDLSDPSAAAVNIDTLRAIVAALISAAVSGAYFITAWLRVGATPGQRLLALRVAASDGGPMTPRAAAARWALLGAPLGVAASAAVNAPLAFAGISLISAAWLSALVLTTAFGRGLHDRLARTTVERVSRGH